MSTLQKTETMLDAALEYAGRGWQVFPVHTLRDGRCTCGHGDCSSPGKHPMTLNGCKDATTDADQIREWWDETPKANVGIATGSSSRLAVLDVDDPSQFEPFAKQHGKVPTTLIARTGKGVHLYYQTDNGEVRNKAGLWPSIDVRAEGGYVVAPPSLHVSGNRYAWDDATTPIAKWPEALSRLLEKPKPRPVVVPRASYEGTGTPYGQKALAEEIATLKAAREGERNDTYNRVAYSLYQLVAGNQLDDGHVTSELTFCARGIGLEEREIERTLRSARDAGVANPRVPSESVPRLASVPKVISHDSLNSPESSGASDTNAPARWPVLDDDAFYGPAGTMAKTILPFTESDPAGLLLTALTIYGVAVGPGPHAIADGAKHPPRLYAVQVGRTSRGRKGSTFANLAPIATEADPTMTDRILEGLASGEGLINAVRDKDPDEDRYDPDKRRLVQESEFSRVLRVAAREGNTLSEVVRSFWDKDRAQIITRKDPVKATGVHLGILAHVTIPDLRRYLNETDIANGFANRFLFVMSKRSQHLPFGGGLPQEKFDNLVQIFGKALDDGRKLKRIFWSSESKPVWEDIYNSIDDDADGMVGAITARAEAQMLRLAVCYACMDGSEEILLPHLEAAYAVWNYCEDSTRYIFGDSLGDEVADALLTLLDAAGPDGLDATEIQRHFSRHRSAARLDQAKALLSDKELVEQRTVQTTGRPRQVFVSRKGEKSERSEKRSDP